MSYKADVYTIMITGPSDTDLECDTIRQVIHDWNGTHGRALRTFLLPWRYNKEAFPAYGKSSQDVLNQQGVYPADLIVAVFRNRLGTPVDGALSGSVEEINLHRSLFGQVMLYYLELPSSEELDEQLKQMKTYLDVCRKDGAFICRYKDGLHLRQLFTQHLSQAIYAGAHKSKQPKKESEQFATPSVEV